MDSVRRIRVEFEADLLTESARAQGLNRSWYRPRTNVAGHDISGLARALISDFALTETRAEALRLELDGFTLPAYEAADVLRDGDTLHVRRAQAAGLLHDTAKVQQAGTAGDSEPKLQGDDKKRSRSARRKAALRARRRETRAGPGAAAAATLAPPAPRHGQHSRGGPPAAAAAPASSTDESDSDDDEDEEEAADAPEPDVQPAAAVMMPHFLAWAQGSPSPAPGSTRVAGKALASGQVVSVRLVELLPSGPSLSPFRDCLVSETQDGLHVTLVPWPQAAQSEGACRGNASLDEAEDDGVAAALGWPFQRDGVTMVSIADLVDCFLHSRADGSIAPPPAREAPIAPVTDTAAQFKAAAAALAASRRAAQQSMPRDTLQQAKRARRAGITGIGPLLRHLRASDEQGSDE